MAKKAGKIYGTERDSNKSSMQLIPTTATTPTSLTGSGIGSGGFADLN